MFSLYFTPSGADVNRQMAQKPGKVLRAAAATMHHWASVEYDVLKETSNLIQEVICFDA